jgi:thiol-disulfide isomerase/thioredoxin
MSTSNPERLTTAQRVLLVSIALAAAIGGSLAYQWWSEPGPADSPSASASVPVPASPEEIVGSLRPDYTLGSSTGERVSAADFDGSVVLVNFWATWCAPCRAEMPMLAELHRELADTGFEVVGIALDEVDQAREFAAELGIDYPILVGSTDVMTVVTLYGNRGGMLPYSVLLDRAGIVRWTYLGELKEDELRGEIEALLAENPANAAEAQVTGT